jgi:hypothetical protein
MSNVTVEMLDGTAKRMSLPKPCWTGRDEIGTGVYREAIYIGPRSKRVVVETDSRWDNGHGVSVGTRYHEADPNEIAQLAAAYKEVAEIIDVQHVPEEL